MDTISRILNIAKQLKRHTFNLLEKINLKRSHKYFSLSSLSMYDA